MIAEKKDAEDAAGNRERRWLVQQLRAAESAEPAGSPVAAQNMQLVPAPPGEATLVFSNYSLPGDALTLTFAVEPQVDSDHRRFDVAG